MTLSAAITRLQKLLEQHGDVELFFDCPRCDKSFTPNTVVALAVHLTHQAQTNEA